MIVKFQKEYLSELYYEGKCKDKKTPLPTDNS